MFLRWIVALLILVGVTFGGVTVFGDFGDPTSANNSWALLTAIGVVAAVVAYALVEYLQTGSIASIGRQFDTRTIVLIPIAIAINIILGQAVAAALKVPIYLDSIGTILVGVLAGPIAGAVTGFAANILWTYVVPVPFHNDFAAGFAIVAAMIGLMAGAFGRFGWLRPRLGRTMGQLAAGGAVAIGLVGLMAWYAWDRYYAGTLDLFNQADLLFTLLGWVVVALILAAGIGFVALLFGRRDLTVAYVVVSGVLTGVIAAFISAPIAANLFGGVTGAGTDFLVAAFRQGGSDIQTATLQQGLLSDPVDKLVTFLVVYVVLSGMARHVKARFPQGEHLVEEVAASAEAAA
ncbi:MAG TPA: hypothetical protein VJA85_00825 [Candidatus Limnocylindria bacterium]|nr:hypothetical protein [Candidatus Limnocylindria bacterium]